MRFSGRATGTLLQEIRERPEIPHIEQLSDVALHVGRYVISQPLVRRDLPVEDAWIRYCHCTNCQFNCQKVE